MIQLTRLNSKPIIINSDLIELIDETPDTIITLTTGRKILVEEPSGLVVERIIAFRSRCRLPQAPGLAGGKPSEAGRSDRREESGRPGRRESEVAL